MSEGAAVNETGVKAGLCPPRGQAVKSADPQGWSAEGGEAEGGRLEVSRKDSDGVLARPCCRCATAHGCAAAAAEPPSGQEKRGEEGREEGDPRADPRKLKNHCSAAAGEGGPRGPVRDPQSPLAQTPLARAT